MTPMYESNTPDERLQFIRSWYESHHDLMTSDIDWLLAHVENLTATIADMEAERDAARAWIRQLVAIGLSRVIADTKIEDVPNPMKRTPDAVVELQAIKVPRRVRAIIEHQVGLGFNEADLSQPIEIPAGECVRLEVFKSTPQSSVAVNRDGSVKLTIKESDNGTH